MKTEYYVNVRDVETGESVDRIGPHPSEDSAEQTRRGVLINLDHARCFTTVDPYTRFELADIEEGTACPGCGAIGKMEHVEKILAVRKVLGINEHGQFVIDGYYTVCDEDGEDQHVQCRECDKRIEMSELPEVTYE